MAVWQEIYFHVLLPDEYAVIIKTGHDDVDSLLCDAHFHTEATRL